MPRLQQRRYEAILQNIINRVVARTNLSDLTDSSALKQVIAAFAREIDEVYFQLTRLTDLFSIDRAAGDDLDERAKDIQPGTLTRLGARRSIGTIVFSRTLSTGGTIVIPTGTKVKTSDGLVFATTQQAQIEDTSVEQIAGHGVGRDSNVVSATADAAGEDGNVAQNTIIKFVSKPSGVSEVTNPGAFTGGRDEEDDDAFRARLKAFISALARSTVQALEFIAVGVENPTVSGQQVLFSHVFEDPVDRGNVILYIDDGAGTAVTTATATNEDVTLGLAGPPPDSAVGGEEFLQLDNYPIFEGTAPVLVSSTRGTLTAGTATGGEYDINPASGRIYFDPPLVTAETIDATYTYYTGLIAEVQRVIDGDVNDRTNYPGYRAGGVLVRVQAPTVINQNVTAVLTVLDGYERAAVVTTAEDEVSRYINNLGISGDVIRNELIERIMSVPGVFDVALTFPTVNQPILDNEVARILDVDINIS